MSLNGKQSIPMCPPELQQQSKHRHLEGIVAKAEQELEQPQNGTSSDLSLPKRTTPARAKLLRRHAQPVAEALWVYQYVGDENGISANGGTEKHHAPYNNCDSQCLMNRAQAILNQWRLTLKEGDSVHCPDYIDEYEFDDESRGFVKLYAATIQKVALGGASVSLGDSASPSKAKYQLEAGERAILVNFIDYPDESRWIVLREDDFLTLNVVPLGSHETARRAVRQDAYPDYQSGEDAEAALLLDSGVANDSITSRVTKQDEFASLASMPAPSTDDKTKSEKVAVAPSNGEKSKRAPHGKRASAKKSAVKRSKKEANGGDKKTHVAKNGNMDTADVKSATKTASNNHVVDRKRKRVPPQQEVKTMNAVNKTSKKEVDSPESSLPLATNNYTAAADVSNSESVVYTSHRKDHYIASSEVDVETETETKESEKPSPESVPVPKKKSARLNALDFTWICTQCNEAECAADPEAALVLCEGGCHRPFHYLCANLSAPPSSNEDWVCEDCLKGSHRCALCEEYGVDGKEVFCCDSKDCGLFFHESCLSMQNVEMQVTETRVDSAAEDDYLDGEPMIVSKPSFVCPAHSCWTCTEDYVPSDNGDDDDKKKKGKGRRKKSRASNCFAQKRDTNLFRCLHCPIAYHISCIPPMACFHELALLCHNHAGTRKMPDLDIESSMQAEVEAKIKKRCDKVQRKDVMRKKMSCGEENQFFPSVRGDGFVADEDRLLMHLQTEAPEHEYLVVGLSFCLPCDVKNEVHSKPPSYQHVYANQYDRSNRPKRKPPSDGKCQCKAKGLSVCDESCLNRMMMLECVGDINTAKGENNPYWNCDLGPSCSNRSLGLRQYAKCKPMREQGKGWGLVALSGVMKGTLVHEYVGEIIDEKGKEARLQDWTRDHPNDPNFYVMALDSGWYIDARLKANLSRFINHSCAPNCKLIPFNVNGHMRVGIYSLCDIAPGEFLSYDYQFDTKHGDKFRCRCGAPNCRGTMKGGKGEDGAIDQKTRNEEWQDAKAAYDRDLKYLEDIAQNEKERASQVDFLVPGAENATETVAAGPNEKKYRQSAVNFRLFLWRNVIQGDVSDRPPSLRRKRKRYSPTAKLPTVDVLSAVFKSTARG